MKIGYHGVKNFYKENQKVGGIFHFLNTIRKQINENYYEKVIVFWDGENSRQSRQRILSEYKMNREGDTSDDESYEYQKNRVKIYLEEFFIRQVETTNCEADDMIAYYCQYFVNEDKVIYSSDKDLYQLIDERTSVYHPRKGIHTINHKIEITKDLFVPHYNITTYKVFCGDKSDNINGVYYLGERTLTKMFPELLDKKLSVQDILYMSEEKFKSDKDNRMLKNILTGKTKIGILGNELYELNEKVISLQSPLITEEGKKEIEEIGNENLDPEGRSYKNGMKMMREDGLFKFLPTKDDAWVNFIQPFMKLTRKEKKRFRKI